jgi:hypothetical protein
MAQTPNLFDLFDDDPSDENLDDLMVGKQDVSSTVLYNTDWTVETVINQITKRNIDLTPSFQRRDAWNIPRKSLFIESILLNFPVPPLTLGEKGNTKTYIVVDGKQRITTLAQFFGSMPGSANNSFKLSGLTQLGELNGLRLDDLKIAYPHYVTALENYTIRTNVVRGWNRDDVLYSIFLRLNSGSVKLSPQELRQALRPGPFSDFLLQYAEDSKALRAIFPGAEPDFRMRDIELFLRYLGFQFFISDYRGQLKRFLDDASATLNDNWAQLSAGVIAKAAMFEDAFTVNREVYSDNHFTKWTAGRWEGRLNRAVFDVQMFYLRSSADLERYHRAGPAIVNEFKALCDDDRAFRESIESTTKSIEAVSYRLAKYGIILRDNGIIHAPATTNAQRSINYAGAE